MLVAIILLIIGIILIIFGTGELITAWKVRKIAREILTQNDELWKLINERIKKTE